MVNSILLEPGKKPVVYKLSADRTKMKEEIEALLGGNFAHTKLFDVGNDIGLYLFVNDLAVPLGLKPNRTFPEPDEKEIIFGNALFLAMADDGQGEDAVIDIPPEFCVSKMRSRCAKATKNRTLPWRSSPKTQARPKNTATAG